MHQPEPTQLRRDASARPTPTAPSSSAAPRFFLRLALPIVMALLAAMLAGAGLLAGHWSQRAEPGISTHWAILRATWAHEQGVTAPAWLNMLQPGDRHLPGPESSALVSAATLAVRIGVPPWLAQAALAITAVAVGTFAVYLLCRRFADTPAAAVAACAYALAPASLLLLVDRVDLMGLWAMAAVALWLSSAAELSAWGSRWSFLGLTAASTLMAAIPHGTWLAALPSMALFLAWRLYRDGPTHLLALAVAVGSGALGGALLGLYEWGGWLWQMRTAGGGLVGGASLTELTAWPMAVDWRAANRELPRGLGAHMLALALPAAAYLTRQRRPPRGYVLFALGSLLPTALGTLNGAVGLRGQLSQLAWLASVEVLLPLAALWLAVLIGAAAQRLLSADRRRAPLAALLVLGMALVSAPYLYPRAPLWNAGAISAAEALVLHSAAAPEPAPAPTAPDGVVAQLLNAGRGWLTLRLREPAAGEVTLPVAYSPRVHVYAGQETLAAWASPSGRLVVSLPTELTELRLAMDLVSLPVPRRWILSAVGVLLLLGVTLTGHTRSPRLRAPETSREHTLGLGAVAGGMALALVVQLAYTLPHTRLFRPESPPGEVLTAQHSMRVPLGESLTLLGYDLRRNLPPQGEPLGLTLYWEARSDLPPDARVFVQLVSSVSGGVHFRDEAAAPRAEAGAVLTPRAYWVDEHTMVLPEDLPAARYEVRVGAYAPSLGGALLGPDGETSVYLQDIQVLYHYPQDVRRFAKLDWYRFAGEMDLVGYRLAGEELRPGQSARLVLYWRAEAPVTQRLWRVVQLVDERGGILATWSSWPVNGTYPTDLWLPQHTIVDELTLGIPASAGPGRYTLRVSLQDPGTLEHVEVSLRGRDPMEGKTLALPQELTVTW